MSIHDRFLALAATAIDFRLSPEDQHALREHLAGCPSCARYAATLREDAVALTRLPVRDAPIVVRNAVQRATLSRGSLRRSSPGLLLAAGALVTALVGGTFAAGALFDRRSGPAPDATIPSTVDRRTTAPATPAATAIPTAGPAAATWVSLGELTQAFGRGGVSSIAAVPSGGFVAIGQEPDSLSALVWTSADGATWDAAPQAAGIFGDGVPTGAVPGGKGLVAAGWDVTVEGGTQRAIWTSPDGRIWTRSTESSARLGQQDGTITLTAGKSGILAWLPGGRAWFSRDGATWRKTTVGASGITDVAVGDGLIVAVGRDKGQAWIASARAAASPQWTSGPLDGAADGGAPTGAEATTSGELLVWAGTTRYAAGGDGTWSAVQGGRMPTSLAPADVVGGSNGYLAVSAVAVDGGLGRAWTWDGSGAWVAVDGSTGAGEASPLAIVPDGARWLVVAQDADHVWGYRITR